MSRLLKMQNIIPCTCAGNSKDLRKYYARTCADIKDFLNIYENALLLEKGIS